VPEGYVCEVDHVAFDQHQRNDCLYEIILAHIFTNLVIAQQAEDQVQKNIDQDGHWDNIDEVGVSDLDEHSRFGLNGHKFL
jgi:hypothetical protein